MLTGQEGAITAPAEAAQSTKHTSDLLRRFKEYATSVKENMKAEPPPLTDEETMLRNEKIRVDDFQEKMIDASRKVDLCTDCRTCVVCKDSVPRSCSKCTSATYSSVKVLYASCMEVCLFLAVLLSAVTIYITRKRLRVTNEVSTCTWTCSFLIWWCFCKSPCRRPTEGRSR